jgi:hypothetical protein
MTAGGTVMKIFKARFLFDIGIILPKKQIQIRQKNNKQAF